MKVLVTLVVLALAGCVRTSVVPIGDDKYMLTRSQKGFGTEAVREAALEEAKSYCLAKGMSTEILGVGERGMVVFTSDPESQISFKCIKETPSE